MNRPLKKSWVSGPAVRKLFPDGEQQSIDALTAVWDEVVDRIISEMMTLDEANSVELHINIREDMVMELVQLQSWLAERVVEKRVTGRDLSSIDPEQEQEECLGSEGADTISATARIVHEHIWLKRLEERWKPKSAKAIEREANPKRAKLAVKPAGKNHFIPRWFIRDHWATDGKVLRWRRTSEGWTSTKRGFGEWGYRRELGVRVAMELKPCVFASFRWALELLNRISRVSEGSGLTALQRLGQAEVITPVQVDVLVQQWGKTLDVLVPGGLAGEASVALLPRGS